mgnify:CR=1 FL=1|jgi:hypothetical protein
MGNELEFAVAILAIMLTLETFALLCILVGRIRLPVDLGEEVSKAVEKALMEVVKDSVAGSCTAKKP